MGAKNSTARRVDAEQEEAHFVIVSEQKQKTIQRSHMNAASTDSIADSQEDDYSIETTSNYADDESSEDDDESEVDAYLQERMAVLEDARQLKQLAEFFLQPERPVQVDAETTARCYFDRPLAPLHEDTELDQERSLVLEEMEQLKQLAAGYLHPELPVQKDGFVCGRNYFDRPSAEPYESQEEVEERNQLLQDTEQLKKLATDYLHPELSVQNDGYVCGRNYFDRPSAQPYESQEEVEERNQVLEDAKQLKKLATDYLHPELPVQSDGFVCGRNYFDRPSAEPYESQEEVEERNQALEDAKQLKKLATDYLYPELPVQSDGFVCGRNYFDRPSAQPYETPEEAKERNQALEDAKQLKKLATDYLHPELPVQNDGCVCGRNYFDRPSAQPYETPEEVEERNQVFEDAKQLKKLATDYLRPELPVQSDGFVCGRNFFDRPSAQPFESQEEMEEHGHILEELHELEHFANDYLHPEYPVHTTDSLACGRNYFDRPSAVHHDLHCDTDWETDDHEHHFDMDEDISDEDIQHHAETPTTPTHAEASKSRTEEQMAFSPSCVMMGPHHH